MPRRDLSRVIQRAAEKLREFGKLVLLIPPPAAGGWNPTPGTGDAIEANMLETGYSIAHRSETVVQAGDIIGIVEATERDIKPGWHVEIAGESFEIIDAQPLRPGAQKVFTEIIARR